MSEVQARPSASRGRGSTRTGRGGLSSRGALRSTPRHINGDDPASVPSVSIEDQGELGQLRKQYSSQLETLKELFPDWTDEDLVFALQETDGDLPSTIDRISEGSVSRFADVKKKTKEKKAKDTFSSVESQAANARARGGRGGFEGARGGRGRGTERGRGGSRGGRGGATTASGAGRTALSSTTTGESTTWGAVTDNPPVPGGWDTPASLGITETAPADQWGGTAVSETTTATTSEGQKSSLIPEGATKSWASMLAQAKRAPALPPKVSQQVIIEPAISEPNDTPTAQTPIADSTEAMEAPPTSEDLPSTMQSYVDADSSAVTPDETFSSEAEAGTEPGPGVDKLTEDNLERLPDASVAPPTETAASTVDASSIIGSATPYGSSQQVPTLGRPPMGGYATSAWKATGLPGRSSSFQRMMEQREAVVMPGNHAVDRAAVQFGQMGLNGESNPLDVDDDREDAETRAQPPQQSPPPQPKTSLPPPRLPSASLTEQPLIQESLPTPKQAPGLPPPSQTASTILGTQQPPQMPPGITQTHAPGMQAYGQFNRYGSGTISQETSASAQKPYDPFSQQLSYGQSQPDTQTTSQSTLEVAGQAQTHNAAQHGGFGQGEYNQAQYGGEQQRNSFQNYYGSSYGQQPASSQQENQPPQRTPSGFGANETGHGLSQLGHNLSRFGEAPASEHAAPSASATAAQQQSGPTSQQGQGLQPQPQGQPGHGGAYPYGNPYYNSSYYGTYMNQYPNYQFNQQGYGAPYAGKSGMYGQVHHGYGSYEHSTTPGASSGHGTSSLQGGRESGFGGGLGEYGRSASSQAQGQQQQGSNYGSFDHQESFGRSPNSMMNQYGQQQNETSLKPFQESKPGASPSGGPPGRTGSAANSGGYGGTQSNFPPPQSQAGFSGYPSHMNTLHNNHGSQYGGFGGLGQGHQGSTQSHQSGAYGNYSAAGFGSNNYGSYGRGGWGGNYGH